MTGFGRSFIALLLTTSGTPFCQDNGPGGDKDGGSGGTDGGKDGGGGGSSGRTKSTAHFTPDELQGILQASDFCLLHGFLASLLRSERDHPETSSKKLMDTAGFTGRRLYDAANVCH